MQFAKLKKAIPLVTLAGCALIVGAWVKQDSKASEAGSSQLATPADGYTIHVTAPHVVAGKVMGPYHHYCKVLSPEPIIECLCYRSSDPGARLEQVEYIIAKSITSDRGRVSGRLEQELARPQTGDRHRAGTGARFAARQGQGSRRPGVHHGRNHLPLVVT